MSAIKLIIFDCYGVVLNGGYIETCAALGKKYGRDPRALYEVLYKKYFNQAAMREISQQAAWELAFRDLELHLSVKEAKQIHYGLMSLSQEMKKFLAEIKGRYNTLLLSKNTRSQFHDCDVNLDFKRLFKNIINTWEYSLPKASAETMEFVMKRFGVEPQEILYIDDQAENLVAAAKLGSKTILYQDFKQFRREFDALIINN